MDMTIKTGDYNTLTVIRTVAFGVFLDDGGEGILLPKRFVPPDTKVGDAIRVFVYHDGEDRLIATTQEPKAKVGEIAFLKVVSITPSGAFLDNGLMKDLFVPRSQQLTGMLPQGEYLVRLYLDPQSGRLTATEKIEAALDNTTLSVKLLEEVDLVVYRKTDIGYVVIINHCHTGVLHFNEVYRTIGVGDRFRGFVKHIYPDHKIDVAAGKSGYQRVEDEADKILRLLQEHDGYLPYHDKSDPEEIYQFFSMSKKTFKMTVGNLYRQKKISLEKTGIRLVEV
jgi:uncharacterized protein